MPINFPDAPSSGDTHTAGDKTWTYDGTAWTLVTGATADHGNLDGLGDDDHTQYLLADGTRTATELTVSGDLTVDTSTLHVDSTNNRVGIGTTTPSVPLEVLGNAGSLRLTGSDHTFMEFYPDGTPAGRAGYIGYGSSTDDTLRIANQLNAGVSIYTNNAFRVTIDPSGNVGIGDATPSYTLDVNGTGNVTGDFSVDTDTLFVDVSTDRVGIGTTTPSSPLHIKADSFDMLSLDRTDNADVDQQVILTPTFSGSGNTAFAIKIGTEIMRVTEQGRVGINDTAPSYELDVDGDINATGDLRIGGTAIGTWTSFTPSWNNFTVGNAVQDWSYCIINDVMIVTGRTVLGTTSSMGTNPSFDIPAGKTADKWSRGSAILREEGVATLYGALSTTGPGASSIGVFRYEVSGSNIRSNLITSSTPFSWGNTDYISGTLVFDVT